MVDTVVPIHSGYDSVVRIIGGSNIMWVLNVELFKSHRRHSIGHIRLQ